MNSVALTFNFEGLEGEAGLYQSDKALDGLHNEHTSRWNFWDYLGIKVINIVVDHPLYYHKYLADRPHNYVQIDIDRIHIDYMKRFYPDVRTYFYTIGWYRGE